MLQVFSGLVNVLFTTAFVMSAVAGVSGFVGTTCGTAVMGLGCPLGCVGYAAPMCGLWGLPLLLVGFVEIIAGASGLSQARAAEPLMRAAAMAELASLLFGGLPSAIAGVITWRLLGRDDVLAWLEADRAPRGR